MVKIALQIKAQMEGVTNLQANNDKEWNFEVKCLSCGETHGTPVTFNRQESTSVKGSRGSASLVMKCKFCNRQNSIDVLEDTKAVGTYTYEQTGKFGVFVVMDCRGMEPIDWLPGGDFECSGAETSSKFDVEFEEAEWTGYDEKSSQPVSITELEWNFTKIK